MNKASRRIKKILDPILVSNKLAKFDPNEPDAGVELTEVKPAYSIYSYSQVEYHLAKTETLSEVYPHPESKQNMWVNVDGLRKNEVKTICEHFNVDALLVEDILSLGQRAKSDDMGEQLFILLPMITYNELTQTVDSEQLSLIFGENYLISFQPDPRQDPFDNVRERLKNKASNVRRRTIDYLCYNLMDAIIDDYYLVLNRLSDRLEQMEDEVLAKPKKDTLIRLNLVRRELMVVKRSISPVRELINTIYHLDSPLIQDAHRKYFKDVYDHIALAAEYVDNYRELSVNLQDLYMNQVNTKMNQVVKILTIVTVLLAPFTVVGSIFGMNFDVIPYTHQADGFYLLIFVMLGMSAGMLYFFWKKDWF